MSICITCMCQGLVRRRCQLLLMHGWPGSVYEFVDIIPRLTDPARFGGDPADAFTVIAPSLPGYGLSFAPGQKRFSIEAIADCFASLMTDVLGFRRYGAQGGDYGAFTASRLGHAHPDNLIGIHINLLTIQRDRPAPPNPTDDERQYFEDLAHWLKEETGYQWIQGTKPQTLAYGLTDSPAGLLAWIAREVPHVVRLRRRPGVGDYAGPFAGECLAILVHRCDRVVILAVLRAPAWPVADPQRRHGRCPDRLCGIPEGDHPAAAVDRAAHVYQHSALDADGARWPFRRDGTTGGVSGARSRRSSGHCGNLCSDFYLHIHPQEVAPGLPTKLPFSGTACFGSRVTATRIRLRSLIRPLVGSNGTQPAPGR